MTEKNFINNFEEIVPSKNNLPYKRVLVIGDVHAAYDKLQSLWKKLNVTNEDLVIFLGDYFYGRGHKNIETLHWILEQNKRRNIIFLRGNVDEIYLQGLFDEQGKMFPNLNKAVARQIKKAAVREPNFPDKIFDFLKNLPLSCKLEVGGKKYFFCHAGVKVDFPLERQPKIYLLDHPQLKDFYQNYSGKTVIVVGHKSPEKISSKLPQIFSTSVEKFDLSKPLKVPGKNILMLDTNAKEDGKLSCVDILSGKFWQSEDVLLFVCSGNTCRSPMAKYFMRHLLAENDLADKIFVDSAGCNAYGGSRMSKKTCEVLAEDKIPFGIHVSKQFTVQEYEKSKWIIALDEDMLQQAKEISNGDPDKKIRLFNDSDGKFLNVDDPWCATDNLKQAYRIARDKIKIGCNVLLKEKILCRSKF